MKKRWLILALATVVTCYLSACGKKADTSSDVNKDLETETDLVWGEEVQEEEEAEEIVKVGSIAYDEYGTLTWYQYDFDENGVLTAERMYYETSTDYIETTYNEAGLQTSYLIYSGDGTVSAGQHFEYDENNNLLKVTSHYESESATDMEYTYDYNEDGRIAMQYQKFVGQDTPMVSTEYIYGEDGTLVKQNLYYSAGELGAVKMYDAQGNLLSFVNYSMGEVDAYEYYEYDEKGNITKHTYANLMTDGEVVLEYVNEYDENGNLISVTALYPNGGVQFTQTYIYAEKIDAGYTLDELLALIGNEGTGQTDDTQSADIPAEDTQTTTSAELDFDFALIEEKIFAGETIFTFGYKSPAFMDLYNISLLESGVDAEGSYCEIWLDYTSEYGNFIYFGKVYYTYNGQNVQLVKCVDEGYSTDNPEVDFEALTADYVDSYLYYTRYNKVLIDSSGASRVENPSYHLGSGYAGTIEKKDGQQILRSGHFTTTPSDKMIDIHQYDFMIIVCWDDTGLCNSYYCRTLEDKFIIHVCYEYDTENDMVAAGDIWLCESAPTDSLERIAVAE